MEEIIRARLLASPVALITTRIDWGGNPQGADMPRVALWPVSGFEGLVLGGPDGIRDGRIQVDCYAATFLALRDLADAVRAALHGYSSGALRTVSILTLPRITREGGSNEADRPFRATMDFATLYIPA